jgi:hypothetical protein
MTEIHLRIQKLRLRLRGVDPATAREVGDHLAEAIAAQLSPPLLKGAVRLDRARLELGSISLLVAPRPTEVRTPAARTIGQGINQSLAEAQDKPA